mgnify:CR=1 FL=1|jgi:hypothetical protein
MENLGYFVEVSENEVRFTLEKPADGVRYWGDGLDKKKDVIPTKVIPDGEIDPDELLIKVNQCHTKEALKELWNSNPEYQDYPLMFAHQGGKIKYNDFENKW